MVAVNMTANTTYTVTIDTTSSITDGTTTTTATTNVALGGISFPGGNNGQDNAFGKGKGGERAMGSYAAYRGSGYGAGGGGGYDMLGLATGSGGGGGFDPNAYYGLATYTISGVPDSDNYLSPYAPAPRVMRGNDPIFFIELTKP
jgi:hypothetical protein